MVKAALLRDEDIADGIRIATDRGAQAINMSFGGGPGTAILSQAIDYAVARNVVLVAAASNNPDTDQGAPASELQPGNAPDINAGRGPGGHGRRLQRPQRAPPASGRRSRSRPTASTTGSPPTRARPA